MLCFVKLPTSFEDRQWFEGVVYDTFELAVQARGPLEDDSEWHRCKFSFQQLFLSVSTIPVL